jgi:hypothetical protein
VGGKMPRAQGWWGPTGPPVSELKTLKIYLSANCNYLKDIYLICFIYLIVTLMYFVINSCNI